MKRFIASLLSLAFVLVLSAPVSAEHVSSHHWSLRTSEPQATSQARTFNLEFVTLSTDANDDITVQLFQNGTLVGTQTTTKDYGDSGAFTVTVPADGQYTFAMTATSSVGGESVNSETRTVEVKGREVRVVNTSTAGGSTGGVTNAVAGSSSGVAGDSNGDGVVDERDQEGQVDEGATSDETDEDVLGEEDRAGGSDNWAGAILAALGILAAAYYWFFYRQGRINPFRRSDN